MPGGILTAIICIILISLLVVAKFAFVRLGKEHLEDMEELGEGKRQFLITLYEKPERFMNTTTFLILFLLIVMVVHSWHYLEVLIAYGFQEQLGEDSALLWALQWGCLALLGVIILIFGEILPKGLGLSFPQKYLSVTAPLVHFLGYIVFPFVWIGEKIGNSLLKLWKAPYRTELDLVHTEEEIRMLVSRSHQEGEIDQVEGELIDNVFDFVDRIAKEVMIPRQDVVCVYVEDSFEDTMATIHDTSHTRYPLCMEDKDHVIGLIHIRDLMERETEARRDLRTIRRNILVIPEVMKLSVLLQYMRSRRIYQAIVVDEYGGTVGLVGLEDILEELVGDIQDEHERNLPMIVEHDNGVFDVAGKVLVDEMEDLLDIYLDDVEEDTIGGVVFGILGRTPAIGDTVDIEGYTFTVKEMQGYRIERLYVRRRDIEESTTEE